LEREKTADPLKIADKTGCGSHQLFLPLEFKDAYLFRTFLSIVKTAFKHTVAVRQLALAFGPPLVKKHQIRPRVQNKERKFGCHIVAR